MYTYLCVYIHIQNIYRAHMCVCIKYTKYIICFSKLMGTRLVLHNKLITMSSIQIMLPVHYLSWNLRIRGEEKREKSYKKKKGTKKTAGGHKRRRRGGESEERKTAKDGILGCL